MGNGGAAKGSRAKSRPAPVTPAFPTKTFTCFARRSTTPGVVRQADPRVRARCWRLIATTTAGTLVLVAMLWPSVYGMLSGYQIESLKVQQQRLMAERSALDLEEARLLDPARLDELAQQQLFVDTGAEPSRVSSPQG